ncbi:MAG: hypothetical protein VW378_01530 [bacterium]
MKEEYEITKSCVIVSTIIFLCVLPCLAYVDEDSEGYILDANEFNKKFGIQGSALRKYARDIAEPKKHELQNEDAYNNENAIEQKDDGGYENHRKYLQDYGSNNKEEDAEVASEDRVEETSEPRKKESNFGFSFGEMAQSLKVK